MSHSSDKVDQYIAASISTKRTQPKLRPQFCEPYGVAMHYRAGAPWAGTSRTAQYGNLTTVVYFNAGVRIYDIRKPFTRRK
jgi:hypothetical protein